MSKLTLSLAVHFMLMLTSYSEPSHGRVYRVSGSGALPRPPAGVASAPMNIRFQLMLPEEDHGELHRLAGETRMAAADLTHFCRIAHVLTAINNKTPQEPGLSHCAESLRAIVPSRIDRQ